MDIFGFLSRAADAVGAVTNVVSGNPTVSSAVQVAGNLVGGLVGLPMVGTAVVSVARAVGESATSFKDFVGATSAVVPKAAAPVGAPALVAVGTSTYKSRTDTDKSYLNSVPTTGIADIVASIVRRGDVSPVGQSQAAVSLPGGQVSALAPVPVVQNGILTAWRYLDWRANG